MSDPLAANASNLNADMTCEFPIIGSRTVRFSSNLIDWLGNGPKEAKVIMLTLEDISS